MSFLQPGKRCRTGGSKRFFRNFLPPLLTLSVTLFNVWLLLVLVNVKSESGTHTAVLFLATQKLWHLLLGTMAFFLLVHRHWQFSVCLFENVRIGSARQLVYPQKAHPPQSPSLSWHITATTYTENVKQSGKQDFVWLLFKESIYRNDTHSIFLEHGISRCFNNDTLLCKYWCATMGSTVCSCK